ncbi:hypothetical protein IFM89_017852 [Coptis chinensis]|uniref:Uncharacterized protein n=1 Tax=Coptis chinensis TaxID=261450 RepID=A0A835I5Q5_9MAGN|nr:hypothetical protein IFM89_017852 [Coptis chinensis]
MCVVSTGPTPEWDEGIAWALDSPPKVWSGGCKFADLLMRVLLYYRDPRTHEYHWLGAVHVKDVANAQVLLFETPSASGRRDLR